MPNWCSNTVTLTGPEEMIQALVVQLKNSDEIDKDCKILNTLRPRPLTDEEDWYAWNINNWGTKWDVNVYGYEVIDETSVTISFDSAWAPPIALYEYLEENEWSVSAYYYEPGMCYCGRFVDGCDEYYDYTDLTADEMEEQLPSEIDEMFGIIENARMWEEENAEDEDEDETKVD